MVRWLGSNRNGEGQGLAAADNDALARAAERIAVNIIADYRRVYVDGGGVGGHQGNFLRG